VSAYGNRLAVRVGSDDDMYGQYVAADASLRLAESALERFTEGGETLDTIDLRGRAKQASEFQDAFHNAAARRVGLARRT
jgi:hypothetical protein